MILPITAGTLDLGPWEQVFYAEFDGQPPQARRREGDGRGMSQDPLDLVREWFAAYNRDDLDVLESLYGPTASLEQDQALTQSRDGIRTVLGRYFAEWQPAFEGGIRAPRPRDRADRKRHDPRRVERARAAQPGQCRSRAPRLLGFRDRVGDHPDAARGRRRRCAAGGGPSAACRRRRLRRAVILRARSSVSAR